jgi:1D-myo-inositol 3-kinase
LQPRLRDAKKREVSILVVGHYCHDTLVQRSGETRALGGSAAYSSAVLEAFGEPYDVAAKAGADFAYAAQVSKQPRIVAGRTTSFVDDYRTGERVERCEAVCEALTPADLPRGPYEVGIACAVSCEVTVPVLRRMRALCKVLVADAQGLLREITPDGEVRLKPLPEGAAELLDVLKASRAEAELLDVPSLRQQCALLITDGERGCQLLTATDDHFVAAFPATERDPTGAGDCFLAGAAVGLARGLPLLRAARLGAWCGARAVESVGVPRITPIGLETF